MDGREYYILVTGSRDWANREVIERAFDKYVGHLGSPSKSQNVTLIHGACRTGADAMAASLARVRGWRVLARPADWSLGRKAGPVRNRRMIDEFGSRLDLVFVFCKDHSRGAEGTLALYRRYPRKKRGAIVSIHRQHTSNSGNMIRRGNHPNPRTLPQMWNDGR